MVDLFSKDCGANFTHQLGSLVVERTVQMQGFNPGQCHTEGVCKYQVPGNLWADFVPLLLSLLHWISPGKNCLEYCNHVSIVTMFEMLTFNNS